MQTPTTRADTDTSLSHFKQKASKGDLFETTSFGERTFNCSHTRTVSPGFPTFQVTDTSFEPARVNFKVCSGHVRPSELTHLYLTSAGPSVVMRPRLLKS